MAKLSNVFGAILSEISQARLKADIESIKLAEFYASDPFLKQMPVPRFRLPEISIDIPIAINDYSDNDTSNEKDSKDEIEKVIDEVSGKMKVEIPENTKKRMLTKLPSGSNALPMAYRDFKSIKQDILDSIKDVKELSDVDNKEIDNFSVLLSKELKSKHVALLPSNDIEVDAKTKDLKELGDTVNLVNINLTIKEDSFDVLAEIDADGEKVEMFSPE